MPRLDGTGPLGQGPMTGRGMGPCAGAFPFRGAGFGRGLGRGRFFSSCPQCPYFKRSWTKKDELSALEDEEKTLKQELEDIKQEKDDLKGQK